MVYCFSLAIYVVVIMIGLCHNMAVFDLSSLKEVPKFVKFWMRGKLMIL